AFHTFFVFYSNNSFLLSIILTIDIKLYGISLLKTYDLFIFICEHVILLARYIKLSTGRVFSQPIPATGTVNLYRTRQLGRFCRFHRRVIQRVSVVNRDITSSLSIVILAINLVVNTYTVSYFTLYWIPTIDGTLIIIVWAMQAFAILALFAPLNVAN